MKTQPLTFEEHQTLGQELRAISQRLQKLHVELSNRIGSSKISSRSAAKAHDALLKLRSDLDDLVFRQFPEKDTSELAAVYYGGVQPRIPSEPASNQHIGA